jgi:two-component system LytT family sensor kinase
MSVLYGTPRLFSQGFSAAFLKELSVDCLVMAVACFPVWWLHFRRFTNLPVKQRLALHLATGVFYYAVWVVLYQVYNRMSGLPPMSSRQIFQNSGPNLLFYIQVFSVLHIDLFFREREVQHRREQELEKAAHRAEINALKAQIQPHFFFNTLNSISASVPVEQEHTRVLIARLADIFRYALHSTQQDLVPLSQELNFIRTYLLLEKERFGKRLIFEIHAAGEAGGALIPPMLLQPLVENAVKHAIEPSIGGGEIFINCAIKENMAHIRIENTGHPYAGEACTMLNSKGVGLSNTAKRLESQYGERLHIWVNPDGGVRVEFSFPASRSS